MEAFSGRFCAIRMARAYHDDPRTERARAIINTYIELTYKHCFCFDLGTGFIDTASLI